MQAKVLVVEDEQDVARSLAYQLEKEGLAARVSANGLDALEQIRSWRPNIVLLDLILPHVDGFTVCREARQVSDAWIIILTARTEEIDRVVGLELGADDYVCKPFSMRELIARVRAVLRRKQENQQPSSVELVSGDLTLQTDSRRVLVANQPVNLTLKEFELLKVLMSRRGETLSREALYDAVWDTEMPQDTRTLDVHIHSLREKTERNPAIPARITTVRGIGYRFDG